MDHVVSKPQPPFRLESGRLEVHQLPAWRDNYVWLLVDRSTGEAAAVDGPEASTVLTYCETNRLRLTTIINTHTHPDHVGINRDLAAKGWLDRMRVVGSSKRTDDIPGLTEPIGDGDRVQFGGSEGLAMLTEGHIDGHMSFVFEDALFCGDTLFGAGCGYLFDGPPAKMHESLTRLSGLGWGNARLLRPRVYRGQSALRLERRPGQPRPGRANSHGLGPPCPGPKLGSIDDRGGTPDQPFSPGCHRRGEGPRGGAHARPPNGHSPRLLYRHARPKRPKGLPAAPR